ncbi:MAG: hypothetical protein HQL55_17415, partial [Magnetococcales bacterium]|nr:hypothetical protein [Magnetococcales bacterium]
MSGGLFSLADALVRPPVACRERPWFLARYQRLARQVEAEMAVATGELQQRLLEYPQRCRRSTRQSPLLAELLATLCLAARESLGVTPSRQQIISAAILYGGHFAALSGEEDRVLTSAIGAVMLAWQGRPCLVVVANPWLVRQHVTRLAPFYRQCGLAMAGIQPGMALGEKRLAYRHPITCVAAGDLIRDILTDQLSRDHASPLRHRISRLSHPMTQQDRLDFPDLYAAIVDDADRVLFYDALLPVTVQQEEGGGFARLEPLRLFRLFPHLCGIGFPDGPLPQGLKIMARNQQIVTVPGTRSRLDRLPPRLLATREEQWLAVVAEALSGSNAGQAVWLMVSSMDDAERLLQSFQVAGITCAVVKPGNSGAEAESVRQAGNAGRLTLFVGESDHGLSTQLDEKACQAGGLLMITASIPPYGWQ